jgi:hypothetical protein
MKTIIQQDGVTFWPKLYFSHNAGTQQTIIMTTSLILLHLAMIDHLKHLSEMSIQTEEITQLLIKCFTVVQECFRVEVVSWDERANDPV